MKLLILTGGSGKRLWPLSNEVHSKQFLKVLRDEDGQTQSMVQRVYQQLRKSYLLDSSYVITNTKQLDILYNQLGTNVKTIVEPEQRDTFPAILLGCSYLYCKTDVKEDELIGVIPVDSFVEDDFYSRLHDLAVAIEKSNAEIGLIGLEPRYPSEKYGYIQKKSSEENFFHVSSFVEKPNVKTAEELIKQGALWNSGIFMFRLNYALNLLKSYNLPVEYDELQPYFKLLKKTSFDYEVVQQAKKIIVLPYSGKWVDLGSWNTMVEKLDSIQGIGKIMDSENTHLINTLETPVVINGIKDAVVVVSPDGILVSDKNKSSNIKEFIGDWNRRPMYEERRWGTYQCIDYQETGKVQILTKRIKVFAGKNLSYQFHRHRKEVWTIIDGTGLFAHNGRIIPIRSGDVLKIAQGEEHSVKALTDLEMIEIQIGSPLIEEDIVRSFMTWEEIESHCSKRNSECNEENSAE